MDITVRAAPHDDPDASLASPAASPASRYAAASVTTAPSAIPRATSSWNRAEPIRCARAAF
ncbi:hypothetical protein [Nonomuraea diastatica]|uniref:Uncharacterized protein n=1 Tax=Nonomuraea diastatica TaxID=1848329 RepID=A0A4R4WC64_9ACTN|nr:hypothetical protein [Nonomuraea diastatica]TDD13564.1 hypothetical protein E1294_40565 [Nonomuraea diastatica]